MPTARPCDIYREQLITLDHGHALWEPNLVEGLYDRVAIGDVGYVRDGFFHRMFNVTLPWDDPSNQRYGVPPQHDKLLDIGPLPNVRRANLTKGYHYSRDVRSQANLNNTGAMVPSDTEGFTYKCRGHGALLCLPHDGHREDALRRGVFENYIRDNLISWFEWSKQIGLGIEHMEDLILVSGRTLVTSWGAAVFLDHSQEEAAISLADHALPDGGGRFVWGNINGVVPYHNSSQLEPDNSSPLNQCVFIRGFRAKRGFSLFKRIRAAAEPLPDDPENNHEDGVQVTEVPSDPEYRDPLIGILDYIAEKCSENVTAIAHDDDLPIVENMEPLTADIVERFLDENQIPVLIAGGVAFLHDQDDDVPKLPSSKMRRRAIDESSVINVETIWTAPPPYEASSPSNDSAPVPPRYSDKALALESPQPSVPASSSSHNGSSPQRVEEVTTPPVQPEIERPKNQPHEFDAATRAHSSHSSVPTSRMVGKPSGIYMEQLLSLNHGRALWEPSPVEGLYDMASIGDVGYINDGYFYRMFNVTLPWDHPSNAKLGEPEHYTTLDLGPLPNIKKAGLSKGDYYTRNVSSQDNSGDMQAREPRDTGGFTYKCRGHGALLHLPLDASREDAIHAGAFEDYIRANVVSWFEWSRSMRLGVDRMEDLILVSGRTLVSSWAAVAFFDTAQEAEISLTVQALPNGGTSFVWSKIHGNVVYHHSRINPDNPSPKMDQCIFIRGLRAKRALFWTKPIRAA